MTTLSTFQKQHAADLERLNERISGQLASNNPLMSRVVGAQLRTKGKQLRPLMLMVCAQMFGPVNEKVMASAAAVELLHNASLIHDDVVDNSEQRRGQPTINAVWNNHIAVLVGDYFTSSAMQEAIGTGDIRIVEALCRLGRSLSVGEIDQIFNAQEHTLNVDDYFKVIDYKTASLFVCSVRMGCLAQGVADWRMEALTTFARAFGRCFQIRDDIFDYFSSKEVGKPTGNDLREGKVTLPLLYALNKPDCPNREQMLALINKGELNESEIEQLQDFARSNGGVDDAREMMNTLRQEGLEALTALPDCPQKDELASLMDFIIDRTY